jgi:GAF domain-containing protein
VLRVIASSPGDLRPVFDAILSNATRLCGAKFGVLFRSERDALRTVALHDAPLAYAEERRRNPVIRPSPENVLGRALATKQTLQIADIRDEPASNQAASGTTTAQMAQLAGARTVVAVPMLKDNELVGAIVVYRQEVRPFTDRQIALLTNFANQAVIAIENARLLNELRESLQQQTATADVLGIISSSPGELAPVFRAVLENATRICEARFGTMLMYESGMFREVAQYNVPSEYANVRPLNSTVFRAPPGGTLAQIVETKQVVQEEDLATRLSLAKQNEGARRLVELIELGGARSILAVPMLAEGKLVGALGIYRQEVRPFTGKHIELVRNFAAQADATAADRHRRRAQGHQPLDLRSAGGAQHVGGIIGPTLRGL